MAKAKLGIRGRILLVVFILTALVFYKVAVLLLIGMLPTIIMRLFDRSPERTKILTVGFMNFAGCFPFCYEAIEKTATIQSVLGILTSPKNIIIMYGAAVIGHAIEWGGVNFVSGIVLQKAKSRLSDIKTAQEALIRRWGPEVSGELPPEPKSETD
jgi:hypothetical protein